MKLIQTHYQGQTLITLLFFMVIAITVVSAAVVMIMVNSRAASTMQQGVDAYYIAESGAENALLRLLRNPSYTGENLTVGSGTTVITVTGSDPKTITSTGRAGDHMKKIQVIVDDTGSAYSVLSWKEIQ